jgi:2-haloacid dehalogenase
MIGDAALTMAATALNVTIDADDKAEVIAQMSKLTSYRDVEKGLKRLQQAGFRLATLTNSSATAQTSQLNYAKLSSYFEKTLSVDFVKKYKPAIETYQWAAGMLQVNSAEVLMVAAHGWDNAGALAAGMQAAFIQRKGQSLYPFAPAPQFREKTIATLADAVIKQYS